MKILITGAKSGIGLACAKYYSKHSITEIDKDNLDLSDIDLVKSFVEINHDFDVLIYSAGIREIVEPHKLDFKKWQEILNVNLTSCFILSQGLIKNAIKRKKSLNIVNIASVSGLQAEPNRSAYVTSKYGLIGLTKQLAYQYGEEKIRVNAIAPGIIETPLTQEYFKDDILAKNLKKSIPTGYWGSVDHIIPLVDVCLTNEYMNGSVLVCDGGWSIGRSI